MQNRIIKLASFFIIISLILYVFGWNFAPGSYPRAEIYEFDIPEETLIKIIEDFKRDNPELSLTKEIYIPNGGKVILKDGKRNEKEFWYSFYFYYPDKNQIIKTWTRPNTKSTTYFAFAGINNGLTLGNWRNVNESIFWWKNTPVKKEFEERILNRIKEKVNEK